MNRRFKCLKNDNSNFKDVIFLSHKRKILQIPHSAHGYFFPLPQFLFPGFSFQSNPPFLPMSFFVTFFACSFLFFYRPECVVYLPTYVVYFNYKNNYWSSKKTSGQSIIGLWSFYWYFSWMSSEKKTRKTSKFKIKQRFHWNNEMVQALLNCLNHLKSSC